MATYTLTSKCPSCGGSLVKGGSLFYPPAGLRIEGKPVCGDCGDPTIITVAPKTATLAPPASAPETHANGSTQRLTQQSRAIAAALQVSDALGNLLHLAGDNIPGGASVEKLDVAQLLDAAKLTIDLLQGDEQKDDEVTQVYGAICKFLEGWV